MISHKSPEHLEQQLSSVNNFLNKQLGYRTSVEPEEIIQPPRIADSISDLPVTEIKGRFPVRYGHYLNLLRAQRKGDRLTWPYTKQLQTDLNMLNGVDELLLDHETGESDYLRASNQKVIAKVSADLEKGHRKGFLHLPTGTGKTSIAAAIIKASDLRTLYVTETRDLVDQAAADLRKATGLSVTTYDSANKDTSGRVVVTTYSSLVRQKAGVLSPKLYGSIITDEAHRFLTTKRKNVIREIIEDPSAHLFALSATPAFGHNKHVGQVVDHEFYYRSIREAVEEGDLAPVSVLLGITNVDLSDVLMSVSGDYDQADLEKAINIQRRNQAIVDLYVRMFLGKPGFANSAGIKHTETLAQMFREAGVNAEAIHGQLTMEERRNLIADYNDGFIDMLVGVNLLTEGINSPRVEVLLNGKPSCSAREVTQRGGRVLRLDPNNPAKYTYIVDFIDKDGNPKRHPISFAEVAGQAVINHEWKGTDKTYPRQEPIYFDPEIKVDNLKVYTTAEEVMFLTRNKYDIKAEDLKMFEHWFGIHETASMEGVRVHDAMDILKKYRPMYPEAFRLVKTPNGNFMEETDANVLGLFITADSYLQGLYPNNNYNYSTFITMQYIESLQRSGIWARYIDIPFTSNYKPVDTGETVTVKQLANLLQMRVPRFLKTIQRYLDIHPRLQVGETLNEKTEIVMADGLVESLFIDTVLNSRINEWYQPSELERFQRASEAFKLKIHQWKPKDKTSQNPQFSYQGR